jgi:3'-phosphoadenosine 5'-phosphosulfate sulfotransferase (PAPS reductase)/FAD synthetase
MDEIKLNQSVKVVEQAYAGAKESGTPLFVNFSGGKDSSTVLLLALQVAPKDTEAIYMASRLELPGTIDFVRRQADRLNVKLHVSDPVIDYMGDLEHWVIHYGYFPSFKYNFCSSRLKIRAVRAYLRKLYGRAHMYKMNGVRKSESNRRKKMYKETEYITKDRDLNGSFIVYPILDWDKEDVEEYLATNNFEIEKDYAFFGVSGCAYCPFYKEDIIYRILSVYPDIYDHIIELEKKINKPAVGGGVFMRDVKAYFMANRDEIAANLGAPKGRKNNRKEAC